MTRRFLLPLCLTLCVLFANASPLQAKTLRVIAGTSLVEDIVRDLTAGRAEVMTVIKGSSCPGHESVKTTDFVFAAQADMVLVHAFQVEMPWLAAMRDSVKNDNLRLVVLAPKGSWLIPEIQKQAVLAIASALAEAEPENAAALGARARQRLARVDAAKEAFLARLAPLKGKTVAVAAMQSEFAAWAGLTVLRSYGRAEDMPAKTLADMVDAFRGKGLAGVIDNYQSGSDAGLPLALELKVPHVVLSNFPGSSEDAHDYFSLLDHNAAQLLRLGG